MAAAALALVIVATVVGCFALGVTATAWRTVGSLGAICLINELPPFGPFNPLVAVVTGGAWAAGLVVRAHRRMARRLVAVADELEAGRADFAAQQLSLERVRLARELHDTVAHWLTAVVVQAVAGQVQVANEPELAAAGFARIADAARRAARDVDRAVALTGDSDDPRGQARRLIEELVAGARAAGAVVTLSVAEWTEPRAEVAAVAVRLVQEGLTNARKHAPEAAVEIRVAARRRGLEVEVTNERPSAAVSGLTVPGSGLGLLGLRERCEAAGGTFDAGPTADGGWRLAAVIPLS